MKRLKLPKILLIVGILFVVFGQVGLLFQDSVQAQNGCSTLCSKSGIEGLLGSSLDSCTNEIRSASVVGNDVCRVNLLEGEIEFYMNTVTCFPIDQNAVLQEATALCNLSGDGGDSGGGNGGSGIPDGRYGIVVPEVEGGEERIISFDMFFPTDFAGGGLYSLIGNMFRLVTGFMVVAWVAFVVMGAIKIITSQGDPEGTEAGMKSIKNVIIGISLGMGFIIVVSVIGTVAGVGNVFEWGDNLKECSCENANPTDNPCFRFRFQAEAHIDPDDPSTGTSVVDTCDENGIGWRIE